MMPFWIRAFRGLSRGLTAFAVGFSLQVVARPALAEPMDLALERLVQDPSCRTPSGQANPGASGFQTCVADDAAFKQLVNQYAMAIAPSAMYPAHTVGFGGFEIGIEAQYTTLNSDADYLQRGTRGSINESTGVADISNTDVASMMQLYSFRIRKGFGFGLETGLQFGYLVNTSIISGGLDVRLSLFEGFRRGIPGFIPDIAGMGSVRTITGTAQAQLTVASVTGTMSKQITIADSGTLTPWAGYQYLWLFGDSGTVDFTPATDALDYCDYQGQNQPGYPDPGDVSGRDGTPICGAGGSFDDFNNNQVFTPARLERQRLLFGLNYKYDVLTVGGQFMFDVIPPAEAQNNAEDSALLEDEPAQYSFALQVGAQF